MSIPTVTIIVADNGANAAVDVPLASIQVKMGCAVGGTPNVPVATSNPNTLVSTFVGGPLVEAGGLVCAAGNIVIAVLLPIATPGTATAVVATTPQSSGSAVTVTLDGTNGAWDDYYVVFKPVKSGVRGTAGIQFQISLDAGRSFGAVLNLGTAVSYAIPNTGITLNFGAGSLNVGDTWRFSTTAPKWNDAGVQAACAALGASQYALAGWGSMHLVGTSTSGDTTAAQGYLTTLAAKYVYDRLIMEARDAFAPAAWGGSGETEAAWIAAIALDFSATSAARCCVGAGHYNTPSVYPNQAAGTPKYRRSLSWSAAVRRTNIPPQRRGGRVKDGSLSNIVVDPANDPADGFIYHDERDNPGLDAARFMSALTWPKKTGFFVCKENLMATPGSQFTELPLGNIIDIACDIVYATGSEEISDDLLLTDAGTLYTTDAIGVQNEINDDLKTGMTDAAMVSSAYASVSQTANVRATGNVPVDVSVNPRGYVNTLTATINLAR